MNEYSWGIGVGILVIAATLSRALAALVRAHAARIDRSQLAGEDPQLSQRVEQLNQRLVELEERVDFAERTLAKHGEGERLAPPQK